MKKIIITPIILMLIFSCLLQAQDDKKNLWNMSLNEKDLDLKMTLLKDYENKYGMDNDEKTPILYILLTTTAFQLKRNDEAIEYGEKTLHYKDKIKAQNMLRIYIILANAYNITQKDFDKAYEYAQNVVDLGKIEIANGNQSITLPKNFIAPALRIQVRILYSKDKDNPETMKQVAEKALEAYEFDKSINTIKLIHSLAVNLYRKNILDASTMLMQPLCQVENPNPNHLELMARILSKNGKKTEAAEYLEKSYSINKKVKTAFDIGALLQKTNPQKAATYLARAFVANDGQYSDKAEKLLKHIVYNILYKGKPQEVQDQGYNKFINEAKNEVIS